jgi:hypothetical protein
MRSSERTRLVAVRVRPNVVLPEVVVRPDGTVPVVGDESVASTADELWTKISALVTGLGLDEEETRRRLERDRRFARYGAEPLAAPRRRLGVREARELVRLGLVEPLFERSVF